jgi:1,4-dihydroxy-2-naphthoate octaprenyltransferase
MVREDLRGGIPGDGALLHFAGCRYWTASLLPALVGTTLPFWLRPPGFSFKWLPAIEFLFATLLFHAGFSFLLARFQGRSTAHWPASRLLGTASACIVAGCLLGLHLNDGLMLHADVPRSIMIVFGISALFVGVLYVAPPISFYRRASGEVVLAVGLALLPLLGAYLVQVGDITRRVYLAALPVLVATRLWIWTSELASRVDDERTGRRTMVMIFAPRFSGRYVTLALTIVLYASLVMVVIVRPALDPLSLIALLSCGLAGRIVTISWDDYADETKMLKAREYAFLIHLLLCAIISASSLRSLLL